MVKPPLYGTVNPTLRHSMCIKTPSLKLVQRQQRQVSTLHYKVPLELVLPNYLYGYADVDTHLERSPLNQTRRCLRENEKTSKSKENKRSY